MIQGSAVNDNSNDATLYQNVPNPVEYNTDIPFKIVKPGLAKLSIVNLLGETVFIHQEEYRPGIHSIEWNRSNVLKAIIPGIYIYRLESNGEEVVKKMLIR